VTPEISPSGTHVCAGQPLSLTLVNKGSGANVNWFNGDQPGISLSSADIFNVTEPGSYFVTVSNHSCTRSSFPMLLATKSDSLFVPNIITPNGDAKNEFFQVYSEGVADMRVILFNRYGDRIFTSRDPFFQWDANNVSTGVYFWYLQITTCNNRRRELKGTVHVVH
jgi:gliding motility-associated-like protein